MNIPQVNATATDRNREQTERICELAGWKYVWKESCDPAHSGYAYIDSGAGIPEQNIYLPNGSFTLDQVVGMLRERNCFWVAHQQRTDILARKGIAVVGGKWVRDIVSTDERGRRCHDFEDLVCDFPHSLTAAMDALIKVLEEKL